MIQWVNPTRRSSRGKQNRRQQLFHINSPKSNSIPTWKHSSFCRPLSGKPSALNELTCTRAYIEYLVKIVLRDNKHFSVMNCSVLFPPKIFDMSTWQKQNSMSVKRHLAPTLLAAGFKHHGCLLVSTANNWDVS